MTLWTMGFGASVEGRESGDEAFADAIGFPDRRWTDFPTSDRRRGKWCCRGEGFIHRSAPIVDDIFKQGAVGIEYAQDLDDQIVAHLPRIAAAI